MTVAERPDSGVTLLAGTFIYPTADARFWLIWPRFCATLHITQLRQASGNSAQQQYPFYCMTEISGLGQPLVDNHKGYGAPVYPLDRHGEKTARVQRYSDYCQARTRLRYLYRDSNDEQLYSVSIVYNFRAACFLLRANSLRP